MEQIDHARGTNSILANSSAFDNLSFMVALDADPRPTFVIDTLLTQRKPLQFVHANLALVCTRNLFANLNEAKNADTPFRAWLVSTESTERYHRYGDALWFYYLVGYFKVVSTASPSHFADLGGIQRSPASATAREHRFSQSSLTGEQHAAYQATINHLQEELRILEFGQKEAIIQKASCLQTVKRLQHELRTHESILADHYENGIQHSTGLHRSDRAVPPSMDSLPIHHESVANDLFSAQSTHLRRPIGDIWNPATFAPTRSPSVPLRTTGSEIDAYAALQKFQRLAEMVDVGFFDYHPSGKLVHANESWYALSGHPREPEAHTTLSFTKCVYPDDLELVLANWEKLLQGEAVTFEMRWKKPSIPHSSDPTQASSVQWVLSACVPVVGEDGIVKSISGCTTDISSQKHSADVAQQRAEALERARTSEERFARFASVAPIAIFRFDRSKNIEYCNDRWFEMTGLPKTGYEDIAYPYGVHDDDVANCSRAWDTAIVEGSIGTIEFRLKKEWNDDHGRKGYTWVYCTFFPEFNDDGSFAGLMGSLLNISHLKWAENMQKLRAEEALEAKRQQENFIDMTSHEMRNPLSAMIQCADAIMSSYTELASFTQRYAHLRGPEVNAHFQEQIDNGLESAQIILSCAAHQKRIVDDILTLSKLDSNLLLITPVKTQPVQMIQNLVKVFEKDCSKADIRLELTFNSSFAELGVDWLSLDPSRALQILINLLTNAIKFTTDQSTRNITITVSVTEQAPSRIDSGITYVPAETVTNDYEVGEGGNEGQPIFLGIEVKDTGRGLNEKEKVKLFRRFSQASPKTHVQYGGSGLGLFISRKLTEMQGGEIGFASESNIGSRFAFYIKTQKTTAPVQDEDLYSTRYSDTVPRKPHQNQESRRKIYVLLVEDNIVNQKVLSTQMKRAGCTVYLAGHGVEALDFLRTTELWIDRDSSAEGDNRSPVPLDIVLMDTEMPVMGGLECTSQIRQYEQDGRLTRRLPIISISANARSEQVQETLLAGADDTITKPFRIAELMPKIQMLIS